MRTKRVRTPGGRATAARARSEQTPLRDRMIAALGMASDATDDQIIAELNGYRAAAGLTRELRSIVGVTSDADLLVEARRLVIIADNTRMTETRNLFALDSENATAGALETVAAITDALRVVHERSTVGVDGGMRQKSHERLLWFVREFAAEAIAAEAAFSWIKGAPRLARSAA